MADTTNEHEQFVRHTVKHIDRVRALMDRAISSLQGRAIRHDRSKLSDAELPIFARLRPKLAGSTYGSAEYKALCKELGPALEHHYQSNEHHPEHHDQWVCPECDMVYNRKTVPEIGYPDSQYRWCKRCHDGKYPGFFETAMIFKPGIYRMTMLDLIEMLCDWKAAGEQHDDNRGLLASIEHNQKRFQYDDNMKSLLTGTAYELGLLGE